MKNRTVLGLLCILLAVTVMFGVAPVVNRLAAQKVQIVRVAKDIPQGTQITSADVTAVEVGGYNLPKTVIKDTKAVIGRYAGCEIKADDYLLPTMLSSTADSAGDVLDTLDGSEQAVSISLSDFACGLSGKLKNGDIVSVIVTQDKATLIPRELTYVRVVTTTTSKGSDADDQTASKDGTTDPPSTATLLVNAAQAKLLAGYDADSNTKLHLSLVYRGNAQTAQRFLDAQAAVFKSGVSVK